MILGRAVVAAPYVGPGDIANTNFVNWAGLRAYSAATVGTKCIRIQRSSDNAQTDINTLSNGDLDIAAVTTFIGAGTAAVMKAYDKVGTRDLAIAAATVAFVFNALNTSLPCMEVTTAAGLNSTSTANPATIVSNFSVVVNRVSGTGAVAYYFNAGTADTTLEGQAATANSIRLRGGGSGNIFATMSDNTFHAVNAVANSVSSAIRVDATETTGTVVGFTGLSGSVGWAGAASTTTRWCEGGYNDTAGWNSTVRAALAANQKAYWNTP